MIKLRNIEKNNGVITCDIYPEDSKAPGKLEIRGDGKHPDVKSVLPQGYEWCKKHIAHAVWFLVDCEELPKEHLIVWG